MSCRYDWPALDWLGLRIPMITESRIYIPANGEEWELVSVITGRAIGGNVLLGITLAWDVVYCDGAIEF